MRKSAIANIIDIDKTSNADRWIVSYANPASLGWVCEEECAAAWKDLEGRSKLEIGKTFRITWNERASSTGTVYNNIKRFEEV